MSDRYIGRGRFILGDCLERMAEIPDGSVDMILCDLPYGEVSQKSGGLRKLDRGTADRCDIDLSVLAMSWRTRLKPYGSVYAFCGTEQISEIVGHLKSIGFTTRVGAWNKTNPSPMNGQRLWLSGLEFCVFGRLPGATFNERCKKALWEAPSGRSKVHPTEKPVALFSRLIEASSHADDTVLDCCAGSGTTAIAAERTGRNWICIERDPEYYAAAWQRVENEIASKGLFT